MAKFNIGDKVLVLPGNYRSGKVGTVVGIQDGDPAVQLEGLPEPELFAEYELRLEKSLPTTDTKALLRAKYSKSVQYASGRSGDEQAAYIRAKNKYVGRGAVVGGKEGQIIEVVVEKNGEVTFDVELDGGEVLHSLPLNRLEIY